jgi:hypothetical protein
MCGSNETSIYGSKPTKVNWSVVRGDTATLTVQFLQLDEVTPYNTSTWTYEASAYDSQGEVLDCLLVTAQGSIITIKAPSSMTVNWGTKYLPVVAELPFDLQVRIPTTGEDTVWTPIIGTISVYGDITPGGSL